MRRWLDRAREYRAVQVNEGARVVADDVNAKYPVQEARRDDRRGAPAVDEDIDTHVKSAKDDIRPAIEAMVARSASLPDVTAAARPRSSNDFPDAATREIGPGTNPVPAHAVSPASRPFPEIPGTVPLAFPVAPKPSARPPAPPPASSRPPGPPPPVPQRPPPPMPAQPLGDAAYRGSQPGRIPEARDVLDALAIAGVFEPEAAQRSPLDWARANAAPPRKKSYAFVVTLIVLLVGAGSGVFFYVRDRRAKDHARAEAMLAKVDADLRSSDPRVLEPSEKTIGEVFELESRSPHAALTWLRERAMVGLLRGGENIAFEGPIARAKEVGVPESDIAFAYVASFLFQSDTVGAAAVMPKWDAVAGKDAHYQLLSGAALERAGDGRAIERYIAATRLDPSLVLAEVLLARYVAIDGDPSKAMELAKLFQSKYPPAHRGERARRPRVGAKPAPGSGCPQRGQGDPRPRRRAPPRSQVRALRAERARGAVEPHARQGQSGALARSASGRWARGRVVARRDRSRDGRRGRRAQSRSARRVVLRCLPTRAHIGGAGRIARIPPRRGPKSHRRARPALGRRRARAGAAVAYERLDADGLGRALEGLTPEAKQLPFTRPILSAPALLLGTEQPSADKLSQMFVVDAPWADVLAMDSALDVGDLAVSDKIAAAWGENDTRPHHAIRLARHARYRGKLDEAEKWSKLALTGSITARSVIERVFLLVEKKDYKAVEPMLAQYSSVLGKQTKWASAYALASSGRVEAARAKVATEDPPPDLAPLPMRLLAGATYGKLKDHNAGFKYIKALAKAGFTNPDVANASENVGLPPIKTRSP
jgi:hypothetical protein